MKPFPSPRVFLLTSLFFFLTAQGWFNRAMAGPDAAFHRLQCEISRAAESLGGRVGVSALHLESGIRVGFHSTERFPMASTCKVPIAVHVLTLVDRGEISLDRIIELQPRDLHPGGGILTPLLNRPGVVLSVENLLELMLRVSDNSATDILLRLAGGPEAVTAGMEALGIRDIALHRSTVRLIADTEGYSLPPEEEWSPELFERLSESGTTQERKAAEERFNADPRDMATPDAMVSFLARLYRGELLGAGSRALLLDIMERCRTGKDRIKGMLGPGTVVAHKTGSLAGIAGDMGIITLPDDAGHVAIALFVKAPDREMPDRERVLALISRAVVDYFLFRP